MKRNSTLMLGLGVGLGMGWLAPGCGSGGVGGKQDSGSAEAPPVAAADARVGDEPAGAGSDATAGQGATDGKCGAAKNSCAAGSLVDLSDTPTSYLWRCLGASGGADAACAAPIDDASTYFIAENGVDATAVAGTDAQPWATIEYALGRMKGGDLLFVKGGTYHEVFDIYGPSGTETSPTVVQAYPGQTPIFSGPGIDHQANSINATNHLILDGLTITNYQIGLDIGGDGAADHVLVRNLVIHDVGNHGLSVHYDSSYVTLEGNTVHDTGLYTQNGEGFYVGRGDSTPVDNTHHVTIRNNVLFNTKDEAVELKIGTHDCVVENNTIHSANQSGDSYGLGGGAAIPCPTSAPTSGSRSLQAHEARAALTARAYGRMYKRMNHRAGLETRRVTANLPVKLVDDACQVTGKGITETLVAGLERVRRSAAAAKARALKGRLRLAIDIETSRERARH